MIKRSIVLVVLICVTVINDVIAQNKKIMYGFDKLPQTLLLNPGAKLNCKWHVGIPLLSGVSVNANLSGFTPAGLFRDDKVDFNIKLQDVINKVSDKDYGYLNSQIEILNGGYHYNKTIYLSAGFYNEISIFAAVPKDIIDLLNKGNLNDLNGRFSVSQVSVKADALNVLHFGISKKMKENMTVGARLKIYSGIANITSSGNKGFFQTINGKQNYHTHFLSNIDAEVNSSGIFKKIDDKYEEVEQEDITSSLFFSNMGLGLDLGVTYQLNERTVITGSLLDFGFINYSKNTRNKTVKGNYIFKGIDYGYDLQKKQSWRELREDFESKVKTEEQSESYSVMRPLKFNGSIKYSWEKSKKTESCFDLGYRNYYNNAVGAQLHAVFQPIGLRFGVTGFYEKRLTKDINTKITYTIDDFSYTNFGLGFSTKLDPVNLYVTVDNIFGLSDVADTNTASFQVGVNLMFK